ncbi:Glycerol kinase OS=Streptomyces cyaneofuscatus OX=66883 GN=glpK PE=3 SV=1 [Streptomyces cyaneofuscatus]
MTDAHTTGTHGTGPFIAAIDQGTTSSRCIVFDKDGRIVSVDQKEHEQIFPKPGWVEHDATEIWENVQEVVAGAIVKAGITSADVKAIGITNQRETTLGCGTRTPADSALSAFGRRRRPTCISPAKAQPRRGPELRTDEPEGRRASTATTR